MKKNIGCMFLLALIQMTWGLTQVQRLTDSTYKFGASSSLSSDGTTIAIGSPGTGDDIGAVSIFTKSGSTWSTIQTIYATNETDYVQRAGAGVALTPDASLLLYGEPGVPDAGQVTVNYWDSGSTSYLPLGTFAPSDAIGDANFGASIVTCNSGAIAVVSGPQDNSGVGAVWVFAISNGVFTQVQKLIGTGGSGSPNQGASLAVTSDCTTIAVGGPTDATYVGATWVFVSSDLVTWSQQGSKLTASGTSAAPHQGAAVSLSSSGSKLAIGGPNNNGTGTTWIFTRSGTTWSQSAAIVSSHTTSPNGLQGTAVYLSQDGNTLHVGAPNDASGKGRIHTFTYASSTWSWASYWTLNSLGASPHGGMDISASGDESTIVAGAVSENYFLGAAYILT